MTSAMKELTGRDPEALRKILWGDEWLISAMTALKKRLDDGKRDAVRLYFEAIEVVSSKRDSALLIILSELGVGDLIEGKNLIGIAKRAQTATPDDAYVTAKRIVRERIKADPIERIRSKEEIYGEREVEQVSEGAAT